MITKISLSPWKKQRFPRKLKKRLKSSGIFFYCSKLIRIANFGRFASYSSFNYFKLVS